MTITDNHLRIYHIIEREPLTIGQLMEKTGLKRYIVKRILDSLRKSNRMVKTVDWKLCGKTAAGIWGVSTEPEAERLGKGEYRIIRKMTAKRSERGLYRHTEWDMAQHRAKRLMESGI